VTAGEQEYDEVIEEYEVEVLVQEEFSEPPWLTPLTLRLPKTSPGA
jgi:hypothetical protein